VLRIQEDLLLLLAFQYQPSGHRGPRKLEQRWKKQPDLQDQDEQTITDLTLTDYYYYYYYLHYHQVK
jgi:hypothetical protein